MATQFADIAPRPFPVAQPRNPNIRVAFVAGPAVQAVNAELSKLPDPTRTLDEMVGGGKAERIEQVTGGLSAAMRQSFLRWLDASIKFEAVPEHDDDALEVAGDRRDEAIRALSATPALTDDDLLLKTHVWAIDTGPTSTTSFGPIGVHTTDDEFRFDVQPINIGRDLLHRWPLSVVLNDMAKSPPTELPASLGEMLARLDDDPWTAQYRAAVAAVETMKAYQRDRLSPVYALSEELEAGGYGRGALNQIISQRESRNSDLVCIAAKEIDGLFLVPMPSLNAIKLAMDLAKHAEIELWDDEAKLLAGVAANVDRMTSSAGDQVITNAFSTLSQFFVDHFHTDMSDDAEKAYFKRSDELEAVLFDNKATSLSGVVAKLRVAFKQTVGQDWSDYAIFDTSNPAFVQGLEKADIYERLQWSAIEDLARIAGVDLKEQGA